LFRLYSFDLEGSRQSSQLLNLERAGDSGRLEV
jgi:hypothetical protein